MLPHLWSVPLELPCTFTEVHCLNMYGTIIKKSNFPALAANVINTDKCLCGLKSGQVLDRS